MLFPLCSCCNTGRCFRGTVTWFSLLGLLLAETEALGRRVEAWDPEQAEKGRKWTHPITEHVSVPCSHGSQPLPGCPVLMSSTLAFFTSWTISQMNHLLLIPFFLVSVLLTFYTFFTQHGWSSWMLLPLDRFPLNYQSSIMFLFPLASFALQLSILPLYWAWAQRTMSMAVTLYKSFKGVPPYGTWVKWDSLKPQRDTGIFAQRKV